MSCRNLLFSICATLILFTVTTSTHAQQTGFPPYGSFQPGGFDAVNRQDLNVNFAIPIVSLPGRGTSFTFAITYDSLIWKKSSGWYPVYDANGNATWGWKTKLPFGEVAYQTYTDYCPDTDIYADNYSNFAFTDVNGTVHPFGFQFWTRASHSSNCPWTTSPRTGYATDGSGYYMDGISQTVTTPSGVKIAADGTFTDTNGNTITKTVVSSSETDWYDTLNHTALRIVTSGSNIEYHYIDPSGTDQKYILKFQNYNVKTNFGCSGVSEYNWMAGLPYELDLPASSGQKYLFSYEATPGNAGYYTGRISRVTLPTGGYYDYAYGSTNDGINCSDATVVSLTRTINDGSSSQAWTYSRSQSGSNWLTTITAPTMPYDSAANQSVFTFNSTGQETLEQFYQGSSSSGTLLKSVTTTWASNGSPATQVTALGSQQSEVDTTFDSNGNLTQVTEKDWGSGSPGATLRTTVLSYTTINSVFPRLTQKLVKDASSVTKYRQDIAYDQSGYINTSCPTGVTHHNDASYGCTFTARGNPTSVTTYADAATPGGAVTRYSTYDWFGNVLTTMVGSSQQKAITYSSTYAYAYPTSVLSGPSTGTQFTTSATNNSYTGQTATSTDANSQQTSYAYDFLKRLSTVTRPDSAQITTAYDDTNLVVTTTTPVTSSTSSVQKVYFDGLARSFRSQMKDGGGTSYAYVDTQYDPLGRASKSSNPYTSSASYWTETRFDGLGRPLLTIPPDGSSSSNNISVSYSANCVTATDQAGKSRKSCSDSLGRMAKVYEDPSSANYETDYSYNVLDALTGVTQGSQTRTNTYDGMGRVTSSTTPEAGMVCFGTVSGGTCQANGYDSYDNLITRTDARGVVTTYTYDTLNRPTQVSYNVAGSTGVPATSTVNLYYDSGGSSAYALGRLTSITDGPGSETHTYDQLGRMTQLSKVISGTTYTTSYAYNLGNELTSITYPSGRVVAQSYDSVGRLCAVGASGSTCSTGTTYAASFSYNTAQQVTAFNYGSGVTASFGYSADRLQMTSLSYSKNGTTRFGLNYYYKYDSSNCSTGTSGNNGQIQCISDTVDSGRTAHYTYDALTRLSTATTNGSTPYPAWGLSWTYDRYGNRTAQSIASGCTGISCPTNSISVSTSTNRLTGSPYTYDSNGNMTNDGANTLVYDAEDRVTSINSAANEYTYDGNGRRVKKCAPNCTSPTSRTVYIFSGSQVIAEYDNGAAVGSPTREYLYAGGSLLARIDGSTTKYYHQDHLSNRLTADSSGTALEQKGHFPFGEEWYQGSDKLKFTTYERDSESGNDYAMARYEVNRFGRFASPDPIAGNILNPQRLNRYTYVLANPINSVDPAGLDGCDNPDRFKSPEAYSAYCGSGDPSRTMGGGGGLGCTIDGVVSFCDIANRMLASGAAVWCPNNECTGIQFSNNRPVYFSATTNGPGRYYAYSGPGALFYNLEAAGIAALLAVDGDTGKSEFGGEIYLDANGLYSFDEARQGTSSGFTTVPNMVPPGTIFVGDYHTHIVVYDFSLKDVRFIDLTRIVDPNYQGAFLLAPDGTIRVYYPSGIPGVLGRSRTIYRP